MNRVEALKQLAFEKKDFDGFLITNEANLLYLAGFLGATGILVPKNGENLLYVYSVNYEQAKVEGKGFRVELVKRGENLMKKIGVDKEEVIVIGDTKYDICMFEKAGTCIAFNAKGELIKHADIVIMEQDLNRLIKIFKNY